MSYEDVDHWARIASAAGTPAAASTSDAVQFLIDARWIEGEAEARGIAVTDAEVRASFEATKAEAYPDEQEYQAFLRDSGYTEEDLLFRIRVDMLSSSLRRAVEPRGRIPERSLRSYYREHKRRFIAPARRDVRLVLTRRKATAELAHRWLGQGRSWRSVTRQLSLDRATRRRGGLRLGATKGSFGDAMDRAVFAAPVGELRGPVRADAGWYVFAVRRHLPARQRRYREVRSSIRSILASERSQQAVERFVRDHNRRWLARTHCLPGRVEMACRDVLERRQP